MLRGLLLSASLVLPSVASASEDGAHVDPITVESLYLAVILLAAKAGGELAVRVRQPAVLGELLVGVLLGNLALVGVPWFEPVKSDVFIDLLARLGVLILLFEVGLESTVGQMLRVGWSALAVAVLGVVAPFALGWLVSVWLMPESNVYVHAFVGATLCATSVGITARVLQESGKSQTPEARVILGAAVIDDVLGLVVLAVVAGLIAAAQAGGTLSLGAVAGIVGKAAAFLVASLWLGVLLAPRLFRVASRLRSKGILLAVGLSLCFFLAWVSGEIGLAPIVGAFAAGLILEDLHFRDFVDRGEHGLEELVKPIAAFLVPVFFVLMGMRTDLRSFADPGVLLLAGALFVAAVIGKQAAGLGVIGKGIDRLSVGIGMIPRGEVGLIFANVGLALTYNGQPVVSQAVFSAIVVMVIATTMITPPVLTWSLSRPRGG